MNLKKITVLGGGSFGTAFAHIQAGSRKSVTLWARDASVIEEIKTQKTNQKYLADITLAGFSATTDLAAALKDAEIVVLAVPCQVLRSFLQQIVSLIPNNALITSLIKGVELETFKRPSEIVAEVLGESKLDQYAALSGPTFSRELAQGLPAGSVVASRSSATAEVLQKDLSTSFFRLYTLDDVIGVELGGALKNVMAIGVGIADGLGLGLNARAGFMTRCLHEMTELGVALGARPRTFSGLSGIGDLMLTCTGDLSRNRQVGLRLGRGEKLDAILKSMTHVAEGVATAKSVEMLRRSVGVEMPNAQQVYRILHEGLSPRQALQELATRELKSEYQV